MPNSRYFGTIGRINTMGVEELSFEWQIRDILSRPGRSDDYYRSPEVRLGNECWWLKLWPKWLNESWNPASGWFRLRLTRIDGGESQTFHLRVGIKGSTGVVREREVEKDISRNNFYEWWEFCSRFALIEHKSTLMVDEMLTITCVIKKVTPDSVRGNGELSRKRKFLECGAGNLGTKLEGKEKALEDFGRLLASEDDSDVTMQVGDVEFRVHRLILSARSPVFSAMFRHQTAERTSSRIVIEDCEPGAFKQYLQYLYTGSVQPLSLQNVFSLYKIADKYLADNLKQQCLKFIQDGISVQTFYDTVQLALVHGESGLLENAITFATENIYLNSFYFKQNLLQ